MRKKPWRQGRSFYAFTTELQTRYGDMDPERHINNVAVVGLHSEARTRLHLSLFGRQDWLARTAVIRMTGFDNDFLQITHYPATVTCGVSLVALSSHGYTLAAGLFQDDVCVGLHECRMGAWQDGEWIALPPAVHDRLLAFGITREST